MVLVFDVGNTNMVVGVFQNHELKCHWRIMTSAQRTCDEYGMLLKSLFEYAGLEMKAVNSVVVSTVVPSLVQELAWMAENYFSCSVLLVEPGIKTGLAIKCENPREIGADRIVNAVAAYHKFKGENLIIVDFGTATTFCVLSSKGEYFGGAIAPGIVISSDALVARAAKLPRVEIIKPKSVIGKNTITSMQSGIIYGFVGQVEGIINRIKKEYGEKMKVIATGGLARIIAAETDTIDLVDDNLTLDGLSIIHELNQGKND